ncbi:hypothetical protein SAY87_026608 [Trapa incisa]|uniref:Uncharacterized protein n=1 Tax=Trapa incisa TaxID=236973 RepID=A0AAN7H1I2_9MYRT|nr:hypothetical protein SAY87_026608 [Trapa incisa]
MEAASLHFSKSILCPRRPSSFANPLFSTSTSLLSVVTLNPLPSATSHFSSRSWKSPHSFSLVYSQPPPNGSSSAEEQDDEAEIQSLRVPDSWLVPSKALEESEWLRVSLHKWLDDEYCPEEANKEISKVAASSYYRSLLDKGTDLGEILLKMVQDLQSISYQDSFHGAFSSANAAVDLIAQRIERL